MTIVSSRTTMNFLPLELLDIILQKSYLHYALNRDRFKDESDRFLVTRMATVDRCWSERLKKRRFKRIIWRRLSIAFNKIQRVVFTLRSNQSFLMETMRLREGLIDQLRLSDCLTDVQSRLLNRQTVTSGKRKLIGRNSSPDLLHFMRSFDGAKRSDCFRCFRQSGHKLVTRVIDNGGAVHRVNLCDNDTGKSQQLSERLNDLHNKTTLRSDTVEREISRLQDSDIEIFHSHMDRQSVLNVWCKSQNGQNNLRKLFESNSIVDTIGNLTKVTSSASELMGSKMIDIDMDQFKKRTDVRSIVVRFTAPLNVNEYEQTTGVTMLRQEICVLCRTFHSSSPAIFVFQNRNPFRLNAKIDIGLVRAPEDIGSSQEDNCFVVIDSEEKCVWKIARQTGDYHKFLYLQSSHLFHYPSTLSVSCDGQELLILTRHSLAIYRAVGLEVVDQEPLHVVQLPSDFEDPLHAVEASSGHFVVLHSLKQDFGNTTEPKAKEKRMFVISKLTRDGRLVVRRFIPQNKTQQLKGPYYLELDSDDRVFVVDDVNNRVMLLDSDLSWMQIICPSEGKDRTIRTPYRPRLCYDKVERQLIVAGCSNRYGFQVYGIERK